MPEATVLVANRGEIAVRIIRACHELGLRAAAVHSDADAGALHVRLADEAHRIGPPPARASYLDVDAVLGAAKAAGASLVHPGYGLLSEDAGFAEAVTAAGLTFVGPSAEVIARMGDKVAARAVARKCGVPVPPGTADLTAEQAAAEADRIGFPLVVKASFGGGGRGMRVVTSAGGLAEAMAAAGREAGAAFGRPEVHLERYLQPVRHVEVQVFGDAHGTVVHLADRDCSVQRRHQKLIEEAPAFGLPDRVRAALREAAVTLAREVGYVGAGTVEFLVLPETGEFFFLEMNTRLQVEHGVTELVTGLDLVAAQLRVALGEPLPFTQDDVVVRGHAIQARIAAEDPSAGFRPAPGTVTGLTLPLGPGIRNDFGVETGDAVPAMYDSLFGKVLAHGADRDTARRRLVGALGELRVAGPPTTAPYLRTILESASFTEGRHDTGSVEREWVPEPATAPAAPPAPHTSGTNAVPARLVRIATDRGPVEIAVYGRAQRPGVVAAPSERPSRDSGSGSTAGAAAGGPPTAPMDATVVAVRVEPGQEVAAGDVVAVLEAMKMEMQVRTEVGGVVGTVLVSPGTSVAAGAPLITLG
ncbi:MULTISPECIES: biotin carboxylase N-terminal domain-containing protein [unclassified Amycolatopsis]|uniref:acetyl/propionyl/methylcrotonyl-CoA carboxylase subunit alpha n=1 Tax=unclassified Amycolatopsis TaxID=2618356 RepID=UPI001C6A0912|nr:biotin carboxylase N-terminal domain-containing protein [Amycolatopsis sp. DSM 110486]QYN20863.1 ATP-grasp domain-containing protein [Amycolatopsis sp. DSM 110486]